MTGKEYAVRTEPLWTCPDCGLSMSKKQEYNWVHHEDTCPHCPAPINLTKPTPNTVEESVAQCTENRHELRATTEATGLDKDPPTAEQRADESSDRTVQSFEQVQADASLLVAAQGELVTALSELVAAPAAKPRFTGKVRRGLRVLIRLAEGQYNRDKQWMTAAERSDIETALAWARSLENQP